MLVISLYNWDYESVSPNRKLNLITWWICFSFKTVDRRSAIIHVFTKTPPTQGSRKGCTVHAKWTAIYFVQSSTDECKYFQITVACGRLVFVLMYQGQRGVCVWDTTEWNQVSRYNLNLTIKTHGHEQVQLVDLWVVLDCRWYNVFVLHSYYVHTSSFWHYSLIVTIRVYGYLCHNPSRM